MKKVFRGLEEKTKILANSNRYKSTLKHLINSEDIKPSIMLQQVGKKPYNIIANLKNLLTAFKLDKDFVDGLPQQQQPGKVILIARNFVE